MQTTLGKKMAQSIASIHSCNFLVLEKKGAWDLKNITIVVNVVFGEILALIRVGHAVNTMRVILHTKCSNY